MKHIVLYVIFLLGSSLLAAQDLIGTPTSLILVYNYPDTHFYLQLNGVNKQKTDRENVFIIDNRLIQVKALYKGKFNKNMNPEVCFIDFITTYVNWEKKYLEAQFSMNIHSKLDFIKSQKGRNIGLWIYDMPVKDTEIITDSTRTTPVQKQIFVLARVKDYLIGINCPKLKTDNLDNIKNYLTTNIDGLVESNTEINVEELNKQINKNK